MFGKLILELGDQSVIKNVKTGYTCDMEFKTKVRSSHAMTASTRLPRG